MGIELMDWQKRVVYGEEKSLAVPAGARSGKNLAVVYAMKERRTLVLEANRKSKRIISRDAINKGIEYPEIDFYSAGLMVEDLSLSLYEQVIVQEMSLKTKDMSFSEKLYLLLELRKHFTGRIVVIGTPYGLPDPIFEPLINSHKWPYVQASTILTNNERTKLKGSLTSKRYDSNYLACFA
jgi:hypothetical protein